LATIVSPNTTKNFIDCSKFENGSCPEMSRAILIIVFGNLARCGPWAVVSPPLPYSMIISVENCWYFGITFCKLHYSFNVMLCLSIPLHCYPLHYSSKITFPVIRQLLAVCWTMPAAFALGIVFSEVCVSGIQGDKILVVCSSLYPIVPNKLWGTILFTVDFQLSKKKHRKAAMTLSVVMGIFLICWFACFFTFLTDPFLNFTTTLVLFDALNWFGYFNSTCNSLIYGFFIHGKIFNPQSRTTNLFAKNQPQ
uniref:G-protein coupled receptors family 1 profile domain-containing protein n=1 Tax=Chelonoidis abingdonii TaxID=106734 RepID=A0A8C0IPT9_CHEAB